MLSAVEARCIVCQVIFCCANCRWKHEQNTHGIQYDCPICRGFRFLCKPEELTLSFLQHLAQEHFPLQCKKCNKTFTKMDDLINIDKCSSISELFKENITQEVEEFDCLYEKVANNEDSEEVVPVNKPSKTAVVTPIVRKKHLVDYESSDSEEEKADVLDTPHPEAEAKKPKLRRQRSATPHVKKLLSIMRQKIFEESEELIGRESNNGSPKTTPSREENDPFPETQKEMTTPTSQIPNLLKLAQVVTTSTPTHPLTGWSMFAEQGTESPLSEIENTESPAQSMDKEPLKSELEAEPPKLKSIIITGSRIRPGSQDSTEKHVTFQDSTADVSMKKKVKFAEDTVFEQQPKINRVYRKPKRMLTPGPQRPRFCYNPRFQALINRFENQAIIMARTPVHNREQPQENTPAVGELSNMPARAINFKEESLVVDNYSKDDSYKTCIESPEVSNAITALTANIAGSLQTCLHSALRTTDEDTEIQFKFVITKKKFSVRRFAEDGEGVDENIPEVEGNVDTKDNNIWSSVARAVKKVFWNETGTNFGMLFIYKDLHSAIRT